MKHICYFIFLFTPIAAFKGQNYVTTYAGNGTAALVNGDTAAARFNTPFGMCIDKNNTIYVADAGNNCIRKITSSGIVSTLAGTGVAGYLDGSAASAQFNSPTGVYADDSSNVYVADFQNHRIRKISYSGTVTTIAGNGIDGYADGPAASSQFSYPRGICRNKSGIIFVGDSWNHRIRKISVTGSVTTCAGGGSSFGVGSTGSHKDAKDTAARFHTPAGLSIDKYGNVYVADAYNHRIRKIDISGTVTTIAGSGATGPGNGGYLNGPVATALLHTPTELYVDSTGKIYIGDTFNNRVRLLSAGVLSNHAGKGPTGFVNGIDTAAQFNYTRGVVCNSSGDKVYVADYNNNSIRKIAAGISVGIKQETCNDEKINIYPNPSSDHLKIDLNTSSFNNELTLKIVDMLGREINYSHFNPAYELNIKELPRGIYTLFISSTELTVKKQFSKQ